MTAQEWFQLINMFGWPSVFIFGLHRGWWSMGKGGVDPTWKEIALRSIETNETLVQEVAASRRKRASDER